MFREIYFSVKLCKTNQTTVDGRNSNATANEEYRTTFAFKQTKGIHNEI
jgi:hypothetical protein